MSRAGTRPPPPGRPSSAREAGGAAPDGGGSLSTPLLGLPGVGPRTAERLAAAGLYTVEDALYFLPRALEEEREICPIQALPVGEHALTRGRVERAGVRFLGRRRVGEVVLSDGTAYLCLRFFRFRAAMLAGWPVGSTLTVAGRTRLSAGQRVMVHPEIRRGELAPQGLVPRYPRVEGVPARRLATLLRGLVAAYAPRVPELLPAAVCQRRGLSSLAEALCTAHGLEAGGVPPDERALPRRLVFEELFFYALAGERRRQEHAGLRARALPLASGPGELARRLFPFRLTRAQAAAVECLAAELAGERPMRRLLAGDVGTGKTAVALLAAAQALEAGAQAAWLSPTEILAAQTAARARAALGAERVRLLTGASGSAERARLAADLAQGTALLLVGTHALLEAAIAPAGLALVVIDEQHRFGVEARARLEQKGGAPHLLLLSATPIPRTLALALHGDVDLLSLSERPPGLSFPETRILAGSAGQGVEEELERCLAAGGQAFVVYPRIEGAEDGAAAEEGAARLAARLGAEQVALVHGRLPSEARLGAMERFTRGEARVLVATSVVEVGVDVPNASLLVVHGAERFGLAQLHQLRGRVARSTRPSRALFLTDAEGEETLARLALLGEIDDGLVLAERDLLLRGPGALLGVDQSGRPPLALADLTRDRAVLLEAQEEARALFTQDPGLAGHPALAAELLRRTRRATA